MFKLWELESLILSPRKQDHEVDGIVTMESLMEPKSEQEQTVLCILNNPVHPLLQTLSGDGTAGDYVPSMRTYAVQLQTL